MAMFLLVHAGRHALDSGLGILKGLLCVLARGIGVLSYRIQNFTFPMQRAGV